MFDFFVLAQACAPSVHPDTLAAIIRTESQFHPFAIGINGNKPLAHQPKTAQEAATLAKTLMAQGHSIDLGLGQINSANLARLGLSVEDAFDPCANLAASSLILVQNYLRASKQTHTPQMALRQSLSAYNTGNFEKGFENGYVTKVLDNHQKLNARQYTVPAIAGTTYDTAQKRYEAKAPPEKSGFMVYDDNSYEDENRHDVMVFGDTPENDETSRIMVFDDAANIMAEHDSSENTKPEEPLKLRAEYPAENGI